MRIVSLEKEKLVELVELWNKHLGDSFPMREMLFNQNSFIDKNVCEQCSRMAIDEDNNLIGFVIAKKMQDTTDVDVSKATGWIQILLVDQANRHHGVGSGLLNHAEINLKKTGVKKVILGQGPYHYFPGIPSDCRQTAQWFETKGYQHQGTEYDLIYEYSNGVEDKSHVIPVLDDVEFVLFNENHVNKVDFLDFMNRCFPGMWEYKVIDYFQKGGSGREFVVLKKGSRIIGFCQINDLKSPLIAQNVYWDPLFEEELGGVGPIGIDKNERGKGYGLAIVEAAIAFLRQREIKRIVIDWTTLVEFYQMLGYKPWKSYETYEKEL